MLYQERKFVLTNTMTGRREEFRPAKPPQVLFYSCGPTVYGALHIGNARALLFADLMYRWLKHIGYDVRFVRNYTDVDDKIIDRAKEEGTTADEVAREYIDYCETDMKLLGLEEPTKTCLVTESMEDILKLIQRIIDKGHAYVVDGEVLFSIESFPGYGKLSGKKVEDLLAGARVEVDAKKRNPMDFALWKPHKPGEPFWESPWGKGRPGWHIECSAMVGRWLGETIDLHHGGPDLIFPHHENEIAQSESATGHEFCRTWVHHALLTAGNEKMSKSLGNILTIRDFIGKYGAELLKFIYLSFHYRSNVPYTEEMLSQALGELERVYLAKNWALRAVSEAGESGATAWSALAGKARETLHRIEDELCQDLNTPGGMGHLFTVIREINRCEAEVSGRPGLPAPPSAGRRQVAAELLELLERGLAPLLNVFGEEPDGMLARIDSIRLARQSSGKSSVGVPTAEEIQALIQERAAARERRDFRRADEIRNQLESRGITLVDSPAGTSWKAKA